MALKWSDDLAPVNSYKRRPVRPFIFEGTSRLCDFLWDRRDTNGEHVVKVVTCAEPNGSPDELKPGSYEMKIEVASTNAHLKVTIRFEVLNNEEAALNRNRALKIDEPTVGWS